MNLYKRTLSEIKQNKTLREEGKIIAIPFPFKRFSYYIPGTQKGRYIIVTANSKVGKTKITDFMFVYSPIKYILENPDCGADIAIDYFSLEMSKMDKMKEKIAYELFVRHGITLSAEEIDSIYERYILPDDILRKIEALDSDMEKFLSKINYVDNIKNPYGIYRYIRDKNEKRGKYVDKQKRHIPLSQIYNSDPTLSQQARFAIDHYIPDEDHIFNMVITDHVALLVPEKSEDIREAIGRFSYKYSINMRDRWKNIVVNVQQQAAAQEGIDNMKLSMTKPSANGLGENKTTQRDCDMLLGLYAPVRYKVNHYEGYNLTKEAHHQVPLLDNHRELLTILNRRGAGNVTTQLFFNGACNYFKELPLPDDTEGIKSLNSVLLRMRALPTNKTKNV